MPRPHDPSSCQDFPITKQKPCEGDLRRGLLNQTCRRVRQWNTPSRACCWEANRNSFTATRPQCCCYKRSFDCKRGLSMVSRESRDGLYHCKFLQWIFELACRQFMSNVEERSSNWFHGKFCFILLSQILSHDNWEKDSLLMKCYDQSIWFSKL